jgi:hypothetical protein
MSRRRLAVCCAVICATLIFPRQVHAGLADIIWEMSGPQMVGVMVRCRIPFGGSATTCRVVSLAFDGHREKVWLSLEAGAYVSTGRNNNGIPYRWGRIGMLVYEPMVEFLGTGDIEAAYEKPKPGESNRHRRAVYFGAGPMINRFLVSGSAPSFMKYGIKLRPFAIAIKGWAFEYNIRVYPDGFTPDEFGFGTRMNIDRPIEAVQSIGISIPLFQWKIWR